MIAQFTDIINESTKLNTITKGTQRFFNDRILTIDEYNFQPILKGQLNGLKESYILYCKINKELTISKTIRIRILNGNIVETTDSLTREWTDEISIDVEKESGRQLSILFDCNPVYGHWIVTFGNEKGWDYCPVYFDNFALLRSSNPLDNNTMMLPRFIISPVSGYEPLASDFRGSVGQPYGRTVRQLRTFEVSYARVKCCTIDNYYNRVSISEPHFIIPYPESVQHIAPMWVTLTDPPSFTKRAEGGWYWNVSLSWKEAY